MSRKFGVEDLNAVPFKLRNISIDKINAFKKDINEEGYKEKVPIKLNLETNDEIRKEYFFSIINIKVDCVMFSIEAKIRGYFEKLDEITDENVETFIDNQSLIIMWPYIRNLIANTIKNLGYEPFYLPIISSVKDIKNDSKEN